MNEKEIETIAIKAVEQERQGYTDYKVRATLSNFYDGALVVIGLCRGEEYHGQVNVYIDEFNEPSVFAKTEYLAKAIGARRPKGRFEIMMNYLISTKGVSAVVAILIALTICLTIVSEPERKIPEVLTNALTIIIGYFFGTQANLKRNQ